MKKTGIIGAMEVEVASLKEAMETKRCVKRAGMEFFEGVLEGHEVIIVRSGIGKVNAAVCTQILVDEFQVDAVLNTGVAGSLKAEINIGDIVVSTDVVHHDVDAVNFGYPLGQIPQMSVFSFTADESLRTLAKEVSKKVNPNIGVFEGRIVSGDQFISDKDKKQWISETFSGMCTEMEGAAIAQVCYFNRIPFLILRAISDKADDSAGVDYAVFEAQAIRHSVNLMTEMVRCM